MDHFPNLKGCKAIAIDTETHDPNLMKMGPGGFRGDGEVLGIGVYTDDGFGHYYPINHADGVNYDKQTVIDYLSDQLSTDIPKVGANLQYDLEWLRVTGIKVRGIMRDIQIAEPLIDEERSGGYSLESLAQSYLGQGKDESLLLEAADKYGIVYKKEREIKGHLKKFAPEWVGPYCIRDCQASLEVYKKQLQILQTEGLLPIFNMESKLVSVFLEMKAFGVRVDVERCNKLNDNLLKEEASLAKKIARKAGFEIDVWSGPSIEEYFKKNGLVYKITAKGNPTFDGDFLNKHDDPVCQLIAELRKVNTMRVRYVEDILKYEHNGRLHACIHQLASDDDQYGGAFGTRSGRLSYSHLNLQKIPKRDDKWRVLIRSLFLPEEGHFWGQQDYSQQEPRLGVHYSVLRKMPGANEAAAYYSEPGSDFHTIVAGMANIERKHGKVLNLGSWYGMGKAKIMSQLGIPEKEAEVVYDKYHQALPFVKTLLRDAAKFAENRGWVRTLLGRKAHFKDVVPRLTWDQKKEQALKGYRYKPTRLENVPKRIEELQAQIEVETDPTLLEVLQNDLKMWTSGLFERCFTYKALNRIIQGSAADQTKKSILDIYEHFGHVKHIQIQVHDELDGSYDNEDDLRTVRDLMCNAVELKVPVVVEPEIGPSWGEVEKWKDSQI